MKKTKEGLIVIITEAPLMAPIIIILFFARSDWLSKQSPTAVDEEGKKKHNILTKIITAFRQGKFENSAV